MEVEASTESYMEVESSTGAFMEAASMEVASTEAYGSFDGSLRKLPSKLP